MTVKRTVVGLLACSITMSGSKPKLKVRTLDEIFKKTSESSEEKFEDTKGVIRNRISSNRQYNGKTKYKRTNNDQQNIHINLKIE